MQQVRYYSAFRVIKGMESLLSRHRHLRLGCCAAYRTSIIAPAPRGLGVPDVPRPARHLRRRPGAHQPGAGPAPGRLPGRRPGPTPSSPTTLRKFFRQQLRWKKSWLRESLYVVRRFWRKNPLAAVFTYASIAFPFMAPFVVLHALAGRVLEGNLSGRVVLPDRHLRHGAALLALLRLQAPGRRVAPRHDVRAASTCASSSSRPTGPSLTMRDTRWGTRASTVDHHPIDQSRRHGARARRRPGRRRSPAAGGGGRMSRQFRQMLIGLLALPLSALPFLAYGLFTPEGRLLRDRLIVAVSPPDLPDLTAEQRREAAAGAPRYQGKVMALVYHGVGSTLRRRRRLRRLAPALRRAPGHAPGGGHADRHGHRRRPGLRRRDTAARQRGDDHLRRRPGRRPPVRRSAARRRRA